MTSSVWAYGFEPHFDAAPRLKGKGKKCGNSYISSTATCNNGKPRSKRNRIAGNVFGTMATLSAAQNVGAAVANAANKRYGMAAGNLIGAGANAYAARENFQGRIGRGMLAGIGGNIVGNTVALGAYQRRYGR